MPSVFAREDHPMPNAPAGSGDISGTERDEAFIDLNDQRIRVVWNKPGPSLNAID